MWQDVKFALRMLRKAPAFTAVAVLSLTLGIGANTTIFTLTKAIFLQAVPVKDPGRVVSLYSNALSRKGPPQEYLPTPYLNAVDYREKTNVFSGAVIAVPDGENLNISGKDVQVFTELVNADFFDVLGVTPMLGRGFLSSEESSAQPVAVLSYGIWNKQFGADKSILGKTIRLNQQEFSVIGVAPRDFRNVGALLSPDVWIPISMKDQMLKGPAKQFLYDRGFRMSFMVARLKPGVTLAQAQSAVHNLGLELEREYPKMNSGRNEMIVPINETTIPPQQHALFSRAGVIMMSIVGLVLLIACANVANLLLARATHRQREIAVRLALGASRSKLMRQLLIESLMLALIAGVLGILCAYGGRQALAALLPQGLPQNLDFSLDGRVLLYAFGLSLIATVLFGLAPSLQASRADRMAALKDRTAAPTGSARWYGVRGLLVSVQVALSLVALVGAGLFIHSLRNAQQIDPGFEVQHEMVMFLNLGAEHYQQPQAEQFYRDVVERLNSLPMVAEASVADSAPFNGGLARTTFTDGVDITDARNGKLTPVIAVAPNFFTASGTSLLKGRQFTESDDSNGQMVAVVNKAAADGFWPGEDPIGKHLHFFGETWDVNVVGEVNTVKYQTLGETPQAIVYFPLKQHYSPFATVYVRTKGDPAQAMNTIRTTVHSVAPNIPIIRLQTVGEVLVQTLTAPRLGAQLLGTFGLLALILAAIGTYGVMSYSVSQRRQEIGVRMALGAQRGDVLRLILMNGMAMVTAGVVVGLVISTLLSHAMGQLLYGIGLFDAPSFLLTAALLVLVALAACSVPARTAMTVSPIVALRYE
ncbi:MAG: ABC transporter permease [Acidobacteria bacterium]|nr:ABC transporter permease [Acidobacteriota bacterium]